MIYASIFEPNFDEVKRKIAIVEKFSTMAQIDLADGKLVNGHTFQEIEKLNEIDTPLQFDIHLLVENPLDFLNIKVDKAVKICAQIEAEKYIPQFINKAKKMGYKVGLSINVETPLEKLYDYVDSLDFVQFMSIEPGGQGRGFKMEVLDKIKEFRRTYREMPIQVDGSVNEKTLPLLVKVGVNDFLPGSAIFTASNPKEKYIELRDMQDEDQITSLSEDTTEPKHPSYKGRKIRQVAFLGGAAWNEDEQPYKDAYETAKILAENGYEIVNGGGPGVMRASTKGGRAGKGKVLAITYHPNKPKRHYEGVDLENDFDDEVITLDYFDRTKVMLQTSQAHIVFKGSIGTLSEFGMSWISSWIHEPNNKPIILFGDFWQDFLDVIHKHMLLVKGEELLLKICKTPEEVLHYIKSLEE